MENLLDYSSYSLIHAIAMSKTYWLNRIPADMDPAAKISFEYLKQIVLVDQKDLLKQLYTMHQDIQLVYGNQVVIMKNNQRYGIAAHHLLWGRMCVIAHFFYHNHPLWLQGAKEEMCSLIQKGGGVANDVANAFEYIDEYFIKQAKIVAVNTNDTEEISKDARIAQLETRIKELEQQLAEYKEKSNTKPTEKQLEKTFTFPYRQKQAYPLLIDLLTKDAQNVSDIMWARHAWIIYSNNPSVLINPPADFKTWLKDFCELFGRKWVRDYEPKKLMNIKGKRAKPSKAINFLPKN